MCTMHRLIGRFAAMGAALLWLVAITATAHLESRAQSAVTDELAYSEQTGYFFFWDPDILRLEVESSQPGVDYWRLSDGEAAVDLWAYEAPGISRDACLGDFLDKLAADPSTEAVMALPVLGGGPPQIMGGLFADVVLTTNGPDGRQKYAARVACQEIVPGESLALAFVHMPARVYNERRLDLVEIEGASFFRCDGLIDTGSAVVSIRSGPGVSAGTLRAFLPCDAPAFDVLAEGREGEFLVDPASFVALTADGDLLPVAAVAWVLPEARRVSSLRLAPGESGIIHGVVDVGVCDGFDLTYAAATDERILLSPSQGGCGGGGAAPVPIDIE